MSDRYAVVGNPISHSKSPEIHSLFADETGQDISYEKMRIDLGAFDEEISAFFALGGKGLNVTVPFKENAFRFADQLTDRARLAGAVNTMALQPDGRILGDTTDGAGLLADILRLGWSLTDKNVLVLGAGGAVRGVLQPLLEQKPKSLTIANRTVQKAETLRDVFSANGALSASSLENLCGQSFDIVINGTAASLSGEVPTLPERLFAVDGCAYDMAYGDKPTAFLSWAQAQGVNNLSDGLGMLVGQAAESFYIWRGIRPAMEHVIEALRFRAQT